MLEPAASPGWTGDCRGNEATLPELLAGPARKRGNSPAVLAPARTPLSYAELARILEQNLRALRGAGFGMQDRIAVVLPPGPELAVALLSTMIGGVAAPLNPKFSAQEFDFYLTDLGASALLLQAGMDSPSRNVARAVGIPVIYMYPDAAGGAGLFRLHVPVIRPPSADTLPGPDHTALLLHTSGTTSRPKLVPLTQANLHFSAVNIRKALGLTSEDCCLNVMPLFHVHGLVAGLLSSLAAGGSVVCAPGFVVNQFFDWMREFGPTWYTAVPTIHQAVLARSADLEGVLPSRSLRFIRSCSAALSPSVMAGLESRFGVPVVEAYGMTEASHQMACNPLPPRTRKPGSVGLPTGIEVAVLDPEGAHLPAGKSGEIAIRGRTVTPGYLNNQEANTAAFSGGWLRTGDIGHIDTDGYLFLSGRAKEMINRAGEKISPREVEEALLTHADVAQAAAFGMPHERLGEEVAAAVVLKAGSKAGELEIRSHAAGKIAHFKVPRRIVFVDEIPKGPTGKLQRIGLAEKLNLSASTEGRAENRGAGAEGTELRTGTEERVLHLLQMSYGGRPIKFDDHFFEAGGDSIQAASFLSEVKRQFGVDITIASFTVHATARYVSGVIGGNARQAPAVLVPIRKSGTKAPFFCVHPHDGRVTLFHPLADKLDEDQPFYAFQGLSPGGLKPTPGGIEEMAGCYVNELRAFRAESPYLIGGYCFGALIALEMARILTRQGDKVPFLALIDSYAPGGPIPAAEGAVQAGLYRFADRVRRVRPLLAYVSHFPPDQRRQYLFGLVRSQMNEWRLLAGRKWARRADAGLLPGRENDGDWQFHPAPYEGPAVLFRPTREPHGYKKDPAMGWRSFIGGGLEIECISGYHRSLIFKPCHRLLAERLNYHLRRYQK
jgi:acyl-CoA synthetase (AMP-forming)/AMP-acid ligase II/thioesterase domain-containing protein/acyl carrier protein